MKQRITNLKAHPCKNGKRDDESQFFRITIRPAGLECTCTVHMVSKIISISILYEISLFTF